MRRLVELKLKSILDVDSTSNGTSGSTEAASSGAARIIAKAVKKQFTPSSSGVQIEEEKYMCKVSNDASCACCVGMPKALRETARLTFALAGVDHAG